MSNDFKAEFEKIKSQLSPECAAQVELSFTVTKATQVEVRLIGVDKFPKLPIVSKKKIRNSSGSKTSKGFSWSTQEIAKLNKRNQLISVIASLEAQLNKAKEELSSL